MRKTPKKEEVIQYGISELYLLLDAFQNSFNAIERKFNDESDFVYFYLQNAKILDALYHCLEFCVKNSLFNETDVAKNRILEFSTNHLVKLLNPIGIFFTKLRNTMKIDIGQVGDLFSQQNSKNISLRSLRLGFYIFAHSKIDRMLDFISGIDDTVNFIRIDPIYYVYEDQAKFNEIHSLNAPALLKELSRGFNESQMIMQDLRSAISEKNNYNVIIEWVLSLKQIIKHIYTRLSLDYGVLHLYQHLQVGRI